MPWTEQANLLLRNARHDTIIVVRTTTDFEIAEAIVGFHVQQACEKCMKAVLCARGVACRRTHDLQELHDLLIDAAVNLPVELVELVAWSPFSAVYRYEDWSESGPLDRIRAHELVQAAITWANAGVR